MIPVALTVAAWNWTLAQYDAALKVEADFDAKHIRSKVPKHLPVGPERHAACGRVSEATWAESQRLLDLRCEVEDVLLALPSPDLRAFARKVIICRADGRDLNGLDDMLASEARRLLLDEGATRAAFETALDANDAARCRFNGLPSDLESTDASAFEHEEDLLHNALAAADEAVPANWSQFVRLLAHMADNDCHMDAENVAHLLEQAQRLAGAGYVA